MAYTYIIHSPTLDKHYIGACFNNISKRLDDHNSGKYGKKAYTAKVSDWVFLIIFECIDNAHALKLEQKIKSMKSKIYIRNLLKYKELPI